MCVFVFNEAAHPDIYPYGHTLSLHDARPIYIGIVAEMIGGELVGDLEQPAFKADLRVERECRLSLGDVARPDERLRRRVIAHREKQIGIGRESGAALSECGHRLGFPVLAGHVQATAARDVAMLATKSSKV